MSENNENLMDVENNSENSSSDSENDDEETEKIKMAKAEQLERTISSNKYDYDAHIELVQLYRQLTDFKSMSEAYERFHECFPLTPKLWLAWINDEISVATSEQKEHIFELFDKAVEDYLSVELWIEYAQYSIGASGLEKTRLIIERGLTAAGLHATKGCLLWDTLRELEFAHFSLAPKDSEEWKLQASRLADVFKRQLSVPLLNMENTYKEWQEWFQTLPEGTVDPITVEWGYKKALKTLETYKPFEEKLLIAENDVDFCNIYKEYIKIVTDPSSIMCLYERACLKLCLNPNIWLDYCSYCFKLGETALKVCDRALRNCSWSEELWITKLRILENLERDSKEVLNKFEKGISNICPPGLELWLSYLEYSCRSKPPIEKLDKLFDQARHQFTYETDPTSKITKWFAISLAKRGEMAQAKKMWKAILQKPENKASASVWLEYINLEKKYGDENEVRNLFQRALSSCSDWPIYIAEEWMMFERVFGTLNDVLKCSEKCKEFLQKVDQTIQQSRQEYKDDNNKNNTPGKGKKRKKESVVTTVERKKFKPEQKEKEVVAVKRVPIEKDPTKTVFVSNLHPHVTEEQLRKMFPNSVNLELVLDKKGKSRCFGYVQFSMEEEVMTALARDREPLDGRPTFISNCKPDKNERKTTFKYAAEVESNKLFVRGLPVSKNQEDVEKIFKPYGAKAVRLVLHKSGQPKGLAYVEFETDKEASDCVPKTDQMTVDGHVISVAISAPPPKGLGLQQKPRRDEPIRHARSQLQMPLMVPRSLQVKKPEESSGSKPKSNADFRSMFLKK
ncbi:unnamed protein product [Brassicogethes aeneus]|uniref:RRM domain-containing protein n=1 Tax=Brassicogethes aeneus TaxID=1431903 RepID=A0A9P0AUX2_BRAAE|nr:unnamed protein product [Brassicogethes aeneus]